MSNIDAGPGVLYIGTKDGELLTLGSVRELEYIHGPYYELTGEDNPFIVRHEAEANFEVVMTREQVEHFLTEIMGITRIVYEMIGKYKSGDRVCWLALHHKKARVRKKNMRRAYRMVAKETEKELQRNV